MELDDDPSAAMRGRGKLCGQIYFTNEMQARPIFRPDHHVHVAAVFGIGIPSQM